MPLRLRPRLSVLQLENRVVPAVVVAYRNGDLTLSGTPTAALTLTHLPATPANAFQAKDGTTVLGTYAVNNVTVNLAGRPGDLLVDLAGGTVPGNLKLSLGGGFNGPVATQKNVAVFSTGAAGTVAGDITVENGNGREIVGLGLDAAAANSSVTVGGSVYVRLRNGTGPVTGDTLRVGDNVSVAGSVIATQADAVSLGQAANTVAVAGDVIVNSAGTFATQSYSLNGTVGRTVTVVGGTGSNGFTLNNNATINGGLSVLFQASGKSSSVNLQVGSTVGRDATFLYGNNTDGGTDLFGQFGIVTGSVNLSLGSGRNAVQFNGGSFVGGNYAITAGNNPVTPVVLPSTPPSFNNDFTIFNGDVAGNLSFNLGTADNAVILGDGTNGSVGGRVSYVGGNGNNFVALQLGSGNPAATFSFGAGTNLLSLGNANLGSLRVQAGVGAANFFDDSGFAATGLTIPVTLVNFP